MVTEFFCLPHIYSSKVRHIINFKNSHSKIYKDDNGENENNDVVTDAESYLVSFYLDHATTHTSFAEYQAMTPNLCNVT